MPFGFVLCILVKVHLLYYKSIKEPSRSLQYALYYYLVFYKYLGIKNICVSMENMSLETFVFHGVLLR